MGKYSNLFSEGSLCNCIKEIYFMDTKTNRPDSPISVIHLPLSCLWDLARSGSHQKQVTRTADPAARSKWTLAAYKRREALSKMEGAAFDQDCPLVACFTGPSTRQLGVCNRLVLWRLHSDFAAQTVQSEN